MYYHVAVLFFTKMNTIKVTTIEENKEFITGKNLIQNLEPSSPRHGIIVVSDINSELRPQANRCIPIQIFPPKAPKDIRI